MPYAEHEGLRIHYHDAGAGTAVLLHHGIGSSLSLWERLGYVDALSDDFRVLSIDARGHGRSDAPEEGAQYSRVSRGGDVLAVLDDAGVQVAHFIGFSMGGFVGMDLAARHPDRLLSLTAGGADPYRRTSYRPIVNELINRNRPAGLIEATLARLYYLTVRKYKHFRGRPEEFKLAWQLLNHTLKQGRYSSYLEEIHLPVLLFAGTDDPIASERSLREAQAALEDAELFFLAGQDHQSTLDMRDEILGHFISFATRVETQQLG